MTNEELVEQLGKVIDQKLEPITNRLGAIEKNMATKDDLTPLATKADMQQFTEDMADFFHETWGKMETTNERVTKLEEAAEITHKN
jgi:hypothetical protein